MTESNILKIAKSFIAEDDAEVSNVGTLMSRGRRLADAVLSGAANNWRDAYEGAREDLTDWKARALAAQAALARQAPAPLSQAVPEGMTDEEITTTCEAWNFEVLEGRGGSHACNQFRKMLRWLRPNLADERQQFAVKVRDGLANFIADNWPDRKHSLAEIESGIRSVELNADLIGGRQS